MKNTQTSPNALPKYVQISELLIREIGAGRLSDGERLPPERDMAKDLGTSVGTLRKALNILVEKQMLDRIQGSGNYIRHVAHTGSVYSMFRLELIGGGGLPRADFLDVTEMKKPDDLPNFGTSTLATRMRRLRYLNQTIIAVEEIWLDRDSGAVPLDALSDSLYHFYKKQLGFWISHAEDRIGIGNVPAWAPDHHSQRPGDACGYIERLSWADAPEAVEFSRTWFDTSRALYVQRLR